MNTPLQIAVNYGVDPRTVYSWIKKGCPCSSDNSKPLKPAVRLNADEVQAWLDARNAEKKGGVA